MTLNDLERRYSPYFAFFSPNSTDFQADSITVVEDRPIMSIKYRLPVPVFYFLLKLCNFTEARYLFFFHNFGVHILHLCLSPAYFILFIIFENREPA